MAVLPEEVIKAWDEKSGPVILTTVDKSGNPNSIYVTSVRRYDDGTLSVADNYFDKTRKNILSGSRASILFITKNGTPYQIKGSIQLISSGEIFDDMKKWNPEKHPGHAAAALRVEEVFSGSKQLVL
jgi:predicted pyridoxine 5'-phosphate oxidase superfamily flavin-nucleotide-binding protein